SQPIVLLDDCIPMPSSTLPTSMAPVVSVPILLPLIIVPSEPTNKNIPKLLLPDMRLPSEVVQSAGDASQPMTFPGDCTSSPTPVFPRARVPLTSVPILLPLIVLKPGLNIAIPEALLPEIRLPSASVQTLGAGSQPTMLPPEFWIRTPSVPLPRSTVPVTSVPI